MSIIFKILKMTKISEMAQENVKSLTMGNCKIAGTPRKCPEVENGENDKKTLKKIRQLETV